MTAQEYITSELEKLKQPIEASKVDPDKLEDAVLARVMSKKFRKLKASPFVIDFVKDSIKIAVSEGKPLAIGFVHGGSKPWSFDEYPEVDWSELFVMMYQIKWMRYIAEVYEPGVWLEFYSMDVCQERMNNLPRSETDQYTQTFKQTIDFIKHYLPDNLSITYRRYSDDYGDISDYDIELDAAIERTHEKLGRKLPDLSEAQKYATEMNVRPTVQQKKDPLWREKVEIIHMSIEDTETFKAYLDDRRFIPACPTPVEGTLVVGSTQKSIAKFWFGAGGLEKRSDGNYNEIVMTPKQLKKGDFLQENVHIDGLIGKNFNQIRVVSSPEN